MWIKILLCTTDNVYAIRLADYLDKEYGDRCEINTVTNLESAIAYSKDTDILLIDEYWEEEVMDAIRAKKIMCLAILLVEKMYENQGDIEKLFKYQRGDVLYKSILELYSASGKIKISTKQILDSECEIYAFVSPSGGVGTTTIAKAYAKKNALYENVLYLNLQPMNAVWEQEVPEAGLKDVIIALKSRRGILQLKLQSALSANRHHIYEYAPTDNPMDIMELNVQDIENLLNGIRELNKFTKVIVDIGICNSEKEIMLLKLADYIVCVVDNDDEREGIDKFDKFCSLLKIAQIRYKCRLDKKMEVFKNKVTKRLESEYDLRGVINGGWAPYIRLNTNEEVVERIAQSDSFENLGMKYAE